MIRIIALNETESDGDSRTVERVSEEALEQIAFQKYEKALHLHSRGKIEDATQLYKDLLDTELLYNINETKSRRTSSQLWYLNYLCYKNLASLLSTAGKIDEAIKAYSAALELDDTDVSLWHHFGQVCIQAKCFEMALYAFQQGLECNPRHWPCLDHYLTLLLALDYTEQCLVTTYQALKLDPGYLRGLVYRRYIYTIYKHMKEYMENLNPVYKWKAEDDIPIDEERAKLLLKEAEVINTAYVEQQDAARVVYRNRNITLKKRISELTWQSVGDSLIHMHQYMTKRCISHACFIDMQCIDSVKEIFTDKIDVLATTHEVMSNKGKTITDIKYDKKKEIIRSKSSVFALLKIHKSTSRRHTNTLTTQSKTANKMKNKIYDTLRDLSKQIPCNIKNHKMLELVTSPDISDEYFGTETEENDVKEYIKEYTENKKDIIDLLNEYLIILAFKWRNKWPSGLHKTFIEANTCFSTHIDMPATVNDNKQAILQYTMTNLLMEELSVNVKLQGQSSDQAPHSLNIINSIEIILNMNPQLFPSDEYSDLIRRLLKLKSFVHILNGNNDLALEYLYQFHYEFHDT